jgi:hypothetical protein
MTADRIEARSQRHNQVAGRCALVFIAAFAVFGSALAVAGDIYQWTDSKGAVHISDEVPAEYKASAKVVGSNATDAVDAKDQAAAKKRASQDASLVQKLERTRPDNGASVSSATPAVAGPAPGSCAALWAAYQASQACFAPYRTQNGLRGGSNCTVVDDPTAQCGTVPPNTN